MGRLIFHSFFFPLNLEGPQIENDQLSESFVLSVNASFIERCGVCVLSAGKKEGRGRWEAWIKGIRRAEEEEGRVGTAHLGSPGPALVVCCALSGPEGSGQEALPLTPSSSHTHSLGVVFKAADGFRGGLQVH